MTTAREGRDGIIFIADFSGFTDFVYNTKIYAGEYVVKELLSALIDANNYNFYLSEIEGDALLFYKYKKRPAINEVKTAADKMQKAFEQKVTELNLHFGIKINMSLKFIVHYGRFSKYEIRTYKKLYGRPVVEAHRLLKNSFAIHPSYMLLSNSFLSAVKRRDFPFNINSKKLNEIGTIYYDWEEKLE